MPETDWPTIRIRLRTARLRRGLTLKQAGELVGVSHAFWSQVESGAKTPTLDRLESMCHAVGLSVQLTVVRSKDKKISKLQ